jgi:hypothetical protein
MSKPTSAVKRRYNRNAYQRYEANVRTETMLYAILEREKKAGNSISDLIKSALCKHYDISRSDADATYSDYYIGPDGKLVQRHELDGYVPPSNGAIII